MFNVYLIQKWKWNSVHKHTVKTKAVSDIHFHQQFWRKLVLNSRCACYFLFNNKLNEIEDGEREREIERENEKKNAVRVKIKDQHNRIDPVDKMKEESKWQGTCAFEFYKRLKWIVAKKHWHQHHCNEKKKGNWKFVSICPFECPRSFFTLTFLFIDGWFASVFVKECYNLQALWDILLSHRTKTMLSIQWGFWWISTSIYHPYLRNSNSDASNFCWLNF